MDLQKKKIALRASAGCLVLIMALGYYLFFSALSTKNQTVYLELRPNDNLDSLYAKLNRSAQPRQLVGFNMLKTLTGFGSSIRPGRYAITTGTSTFTLFRNLRNGHQEPVQLTIPNVRTINLLAAELAKHLMVDSAGWAQKLTDPNFCAQFGYDTASIPCIFIPNTYEIYWNITPERLMKRMKKESNAFWNDQRRRQASEAGLTPNGVITIASIVDQETANNAEKPMIAGMYINRYKAGMKLQADPTVKFATRQFQLRRIAGPILFTNSPYNTYKYAGLPPGPICIPSLASIEAVLHYVHHDYMYMCAKEDFSGTHNFARTYQEQQINAKKYQDALNNRGISQ